MAKKAPTEISDRIHHAISLVHLAFMQHKSSGDSSARKKYWLEAWSEIKTLSPEELDEFKKGIDVVRQTMRKLNQKVDQLREKKVRKAQEVHSLSIANEWEEDEFLDSSANLPVFNLKKQAKTEGKQWVMTRPMEKPKTTVQVCQALWVSLTNRAIYIVDKGKKNVPPDTVRDQMIEKHRLAVLPHLLDDQVVTDQLTGKPLMNLYKITPEVKETILWLLAERAKAEKKFCKLYVEFLEQEVIAKAPMFEWAQKFTPQAKKILKTLA